MRKKLSFRMQTLCQNKRMYITAALEPIPSFIDHRLLRRHRTHQRDLER